jgi:hypothetical protein
MFAEDGKVTHSSGEVILGWILAGQATQDVFHQLSDNAWWRAHHVHDHPVFRSEISPRSGGREHQGKKGTNAFHFVLRHVAFWNRYVADLREAEKATPPPTNFRGTDIRPKRESSTR